MEQHSLECIEHAGAFDTGAATPFRVASNVDCVDIAFTSDTGAATPLRVASSVDCVGIAFTVAPCERLEHLERLELFCVFSGLDSQPLDSIAVDTCFELGPLNTADESVDPREPLEQQRSRFSGQD